MNSDAKPTQVIIQCPSCQAKFALSVDSLEGVEFPRFHCSRCDHIFSREESLLQIEPAAVPLAEDHSDAAADSESAFAADDEAASWAADGPPGAAAAGRSLEVPRTYDSRRPFSAPHENAAEERHVRMVGKGTSQMELNFALSGAAGAGPQAEAAWTAPDLTASVSKEALADYREAADPDLDRSLAKLPAQAHWEALAHARPVVWRGCVYLIGPIVFFLMLLWGAGYLLRANAALADRLSQALFPEANRVPPPELIINRLKQREVMLEDGEGVHLVSGLLENRSNEPLYDIEIEVLTFNEAGKRLNEAKVNAGSTLAKTRIRSLSWDMIQELQSRTPIKRFALKAGESSEFAVALPRESVRPARYYAARIYSVRN